jgi:hypothetical protein
MSFDFFNLGYSQMVSSLALLGGFLGGSVFYFANQVTRLDTSIWVRALNFILFLAVLCSFLSILWFLFTNGSILVDYSKTLPENNQISINLSCTDSMNCSANVPNNLKISCPPQNCPSPPVCQNQTVNVTPQKNIVSSDVITTEDIKKSNETLFSH